VQQIERKERMPQVVGDAHEEHQIEPSSEFADVVHRHAVKFDFGAGDLRGEARLRKIRFVEIDAHHQVRAPALHFEGVEPCVAAHIEYCPAAQILRD
jgi:hypothetical protein